MPENKPTRGAKEPAAAVKEAAPNVAEKTAPAERRGEAPASQADKDGIHPDPIQGLFRILAENIQHNTALLELIGKRSAEQTRAEQTADRAPGVEQLRTILNYKAIGQMTGRSGTGTAFQDNLIAADREFFDDNKIDQLTLFALPAGAAKVSVQVDGVANPEVQVLSVSQGRAEVDLGDATKGRDIGRIEILNNANEPIRLGPRMVAVPTNSSA